MTHHPIVVTALLGIAVGVAILCSAGMAVVRSTLDRLHFAAPVVSLSVGLIVIAVWIDESDAQARIKVLIVALLLFGMNSILTHATARAARIHQQGQWEPGPDERIPITGRDAAVSDGESQEPGK